MPDVGVGRHHEVVARNRRRSVALLVANQSLLGVAGAALGGYFAGATGAVVGAVVLLGVGLLSAWRAPSTAASLAGARPVDASVAPELHSAMDDVALAAGVVPPRVYLVDDPAPNAFAFGFRPESCGVAVTTGLLGALSPRELRAVLAHELAHITNRDTQVMTVAVGTSGILAVLADVLWRWGFFFGGTRNRSSSSSGDSSGALLFIATLAFTALAALASRLLVLAVSRHREQLADATAVDMLRDPDGLRRALEKLEADTTVVQRRSRALAHMWIESPLDHGAKASALDRMFNTHPPIAERIAVLRQLAGMDPTARGPVDPRPVPVATGAAPQGWYSDPWGAAAHRWWDGMAWTGHTR